MPTWGPIPESLSLCVSTRTDLRPLGKAPWKSYVHKVRGNARSRGTWGVGPIVRTPEHPEQSEGVREVRGEILDPGALLQPTATQRRSKTSTGLQQELAHGTSKNYNRERREPLVIDHHNARRNHHGKHVPREHIDLCCRRILASASAKLLGPKKKGGEGVPIETRGRCPEQWGSHPPLPPGNAQGPAPPQIRTYNKGLGQRGNGML